MTKLQHLRPLLINHCSPLRRLMSRKSRTSDSKGETTNETTKKANRPVFAPETPLRVEDIEAPTNCCMSGCPNCVWIEYAEKLSMVLKDSPKDIQKLIMDKVQDPNMRAFLSMELRVRKIIE